MTTKNIHICDFNLTFDLFGYENRVGMLDYFEKIVYPVFTSGHDRPYGKNNYFFYDVQLREINDRLLLTGLFVNDKKIPKDATVKNGKLVFLDDPEELELAAISWFGIYLDNHRMFYIKNQGESPALSTFTSTVKKFVKAQVASRQDTIIENVYISVDNINSQKELEQIRKKTDIIQTAKVVISHPNPRASQKGNLYQVAKDTTSYYNQDEITIRSKNIKNPKIFFKDLIDTSVSFKETKLNILTKSGDTMTVTGDEFAEKLPIKLDKDQSEEERRESIIETSKQSKTLNEDAIYISDNTVSIAAQKKIQQRIRSLMKSYRDDIK